MYRLWQIKEQTNLNLSCWVAASVCLHIDPISLWKPAEGKWYTFFPKDILFFAILRMAVKCAFLHVGKNSLCGDLNQVQLSDCEHGGMWLISYSTIKPHSSTSLTPRIMCMEAFSSWRRPQSSKEMFYQGWMRLLRRALFWLAATARDVTFRFQTAVVWVLAVKIKFWSRCL